LEKADEVGQKKSRRGKEKFKRRELPIINNETWGKKQGLCQGKKHSQEAIVGYSEVFGFMGEKKKMD